MFTICYGAATLSQELHGTAKGMCVRFHRNQRSALPGSRPWRAGPSDIGASTHIFNMLLEGPVLIRSRLPWPGSRAAVVCTAPLHIPRIPGRCRSGMTRPGRNTSVRGRNGRDETSRATPGTHRPIVEVTEGRCNFYTDSGRSISSSRRPRTSEGCGRRPASRARPGR
jgi:hypothetical protein